MKHLENLFQIAMEMAEIRNSNTKEMREVFGSEMEGENWTEFAFVFDYLLSNFEDFKEQVNRLEKEDFEKIDRIINENATDSDFEFAGEMVKEYMQSKKIGESSQKRTS